MATGPAASDPGSGAGRPSGSAPDTAGARTSVEAQIEAQVETQVEALVEALVARHRLQRAPLAQAVVSFREAGSGPAVVLLHGVGSSSASWAHQLDGLSGRHRVIAWDAPGYGGSTPLPAEAPAASDYAEVLGRFVDHLGLDRFVLVGHSLGALIAGAFAARSPQRLRGLMLASPAGGHARLPIETRQARLEQRIGQMQSLGPAGLARERGAHLLSAQADPAAVALVRWNMARLDPDGYAQAARMLAQGDLIADLAALASAQLPRMPVQVLVGSADTVTPESACRAIADACPGAGWRVLPGLGHALYIEAPSTANAAIEDFIASLGA